MRAVCGDAGSPRAFGADRAGIIRTGLRRARIILPLAAALCGACGPEPVTEIYVCYSIDPAFTSSAGEVRICAQTDDGRRVLFGCDGSPVGRVSDGELSQGFVRERASGVFVELEADVTDPTGTYTIAQGARVPFQSDRVVGVSLHIEPACADHPCSFGETCAAGVCVPLPLDPACLADLGDRPRPGCSDPRVARGCDGVR